MQDSEERNYWFKRRQFGYGWTPVTWQGWLTVVLFLVVIFLGAQLLIETPRKVFSTGSLLFVALLVIAVVALVTISLVKGPKPKWRWGSKATDDPSEDF